MHAYVMQDRNFNKYTTFCRFAKPLHVFRKRMLNNMEAISSSFKRLNHTCLIIREKTFFRIDWFISYCVSSRFRIISQTGSTPLPVKGCKSKTFNCLVLIAFDQRGYICYDKEPRFTWPHSKDRLVASYDQAMCTEANSFFPESPWD